MSTKKDIIILVIKTEYRYYVYTLLSLRDFSLYTGLTTDLKQRLTDHNRGLHVPERIKIPFKLIHYEYFTNLDDAKARENFLKTNVGRAQLKDSLKKTIRNLRSFPYQLFRYKKD